jgi:hypothetical protein
MNYSAVDNEVKKEMRGHWRKYALRCFPQPAKDQSAQKRSQRKKADIKAGLHRESHKKGALVCRMTQRRNNNSSTAACLPQHTLDKTPIDQLFGSADKTGDKNKHFQAAGERGISAGYAIDTAKTYSKGRTYKYKMEVFFRKARETEYLRYGRK